MYGRVNDKADVYTFGVVLLELITDCRAIEPERLEGKDQLIIWGRPLLDERSLDKLVDPWLGRTCNVCQMQTIISAAALCLQPSSQHQPQIKQVLKILDKDKGEERSQSPETQAVDFDGI
ncbi:unnamed protein product [Sphagnum jensenii]